MRYIALDVETANADRSSICSIGFAEFSQGQPTCVWYSLINPQQHFDWKNVSIHGLTEDHVTDAPTFADVLPELRRYLNGEIVFSHMPFDRTAMTAACVRARQPDLACTWADSAKLARRVWDQCRSSGYGLKPVCEIIGFEFAHHNALEDALASGMIVAAAARRTGLDVEGMLRLQGRPLGKH